MRFDADHPAPAELLAVYLGTLDPEERDLIEEHLSKCPECAQTVLDFEAFPDLESVDRGDSELRTRLEDQKRRLIERSREEPLERAESPTRGWIGLWLASPAVAWAVAAVFFVAAVGLAVWRGPDTSEVQPFVGSVTQERSLADVQAIPLGEKRIVMLLALQDRHREYPKYRVELRNGPDDVVESWDIDHIHQDRYLSFEVRSGRVSPGIYYFEVFEPEADESLGTVFVEFTAPTDSPSEDE